MTTDTSRTEIGTGPTSGSDASPPAPPGRPWSLWAGSALLGALGLLLAGTGAVGDEPEPAMAAVGVVVLVAAVLPLVLRVVGWWVAVVVCGLLAALVLMGLSADPNGALAVGACWVAVTGALLLLARPVAGSSAARVEAPARDHAVDLAGGTAPAHGLRRPEGWTAEWAGGWVKFVLMSLFGGFCLLVGGLLTVASLSSDPDAPPRGTSVLALAFGAAVVAAVPIFWPRRTARPELRDLSAHGSGSGVAFPYSRARTRAALVGSAAFALAPADGRSSRRPSVLAWSTDRARRSSRGRRSATSWPTRSRRTTAASPSTSHTSPCSPNPVPSVTRTPSRRRWPGSGVAGPGRTLCGRCAPSPSTPSSS